MYTNAISEQVMLYSETMSDAVGGGASGGDHTRAAAAVIGRAIAVSRRGIGVLRKEQGMHHFEALRLADGSGGHGAGRREITLSSTDVVPNCQSSSHMCKSSSASRPRS